LKNEYKSLLLLFSELVSVKLKLRLIEVPNEKRLNIVFCIFGADWSKFSFASLLKSNRAELELSESFKLLFELNKSGFLFIDLDLASDMAFGFFHGDC